MKKENVITLLCLIVAILAVAVFTLLPYLDKKPDVAPAENSILKSPELFVKPVEPEPEIKADPEPADMSNALFIGDSRTVGIMEYSGISEADYFCNSGMNVFNVRKKTVSVQNVGKMTLEELLSNKKYGKIYVMLGINEVGYNFKNILNRYSELLDLIAETQPNAAVFVMANLHVSKSRSDKDDIINNPSLDSLNKELKDLATERGLYYLDANVLFDDGEGNLSSDKTQDSAHLYAKYYAEWGDWISKKTAEYFKEE